MTFTYDSLDSYQNSKFFKSVRMYVNLCIGAQTRTSIPEVNNHDGLSIVLLVFVLVAGTVPKQTRAHQSLS